MTRRGSDLPLTKRGEIDMTQIDLGPVPGPSPQAGDEAALSKALVVTLRRAEKAEERAARIERGWNSLNETLGGVVRDHSEERDRLTARIAALETALAPFANECTLDVDGEEHTNDTEIWQSHNATNVRSAIFAARASR